MDAAAGDREQSEPLNDCPLESVLQTQLAEHFALVIVHLLMTVFVESLNTQLPFPEHIVDDDEDGHVLLGSRQTDEHRPNIQSEFVTQIYPTVPGNGPLGVGLPPGVVGTYGFVALKHLVLALPTMPVKPVKQLEQVFGTV